MSVRDCVEEIEKIIDEGIGFPGSRKVIVNGEEIRRLLKEIDEYLPTDIHEAKNIVRDRAEIIENAKRERDKLISDTEKRRAEMVKESEINKLAQKQASELLSETKRKCTEIRKAANEYVNDLMKRTDEMIAASLTELRAAGQSLRETQRNYEKNLAERALSEKNTFLEGKPSSSESAQKETEN